MFLKHETQHLIESVLDTEANKEFFELCYNEFDTQPDGVNIFMSSICYYELLDDYLDYGGVSFDDYWLMLDNHETQDMKLAKDKLVYIYTTLMQDSSYSDKYASFLKKSLDYCIPF